MRLFPCLYIVKHILYFNLYAEYSDMTTTYTVRNSYKRRY